MKRTKEEILSQLKVVLGDNTSDEAVTLLEDITDTLTDAGTNEIDELNKTIVQLKEQLKDNDDMWRNKYTSRFFSTDPIPSGKPKEDDLLPPEEDPEDEKESFDDLLKVD